MISAVPVLIMMKTRQSGSAGIFAGAQEVLFRMPAISVFAKLAYTIISVKWQATLSRACVRGFRLTIILLLQNTRVMILRYQTLEQDFQQASMWIHFPLQSVPCLV